MRLIDADALKDIFFGPPGYYTTAYLTDLIDRMPTVGGWVSVKDRLPEKSGFVITFVPFQIDYKIDCMYYNDEYKAFNAHFTPETAIDSVTHWMPLPEPPEKMEDE